jgi:hypothetical protein
VYLRYENLTQPKSKTIDRVSRTITLATKVNAKKRSEEHANRAHHFGIDGPRGRERENGRELGLPEENVVKNLGYRVSKKGSW